MREIDILPPVVGWSGLKKKYLKNYLEAIPGRPSTYEIQTAAIKGTVTILKRDPSNTASTKCRPQVWGPLHSVNEK